MSNHQYIPGYGQQPYQQVSSWQNQTGQTQQYSPQAVETGDQSQTTTTTTKRIISYQQAQQEQSLQAVPQPAPPAPANYDFLRRDAPPPEPPQQASTQQTTSTSATTHVTGGQARQAAAAQGATSLHQFDKSVQEMLMTASQSACPRGFRYYKCTEGYLCGGGSHFVGDEQVDMVMMGYTPYPMIEQVNVPEIGERCVAPPQEGWHEPMHWDPATRLANMMPVMPLKYDGTPHVMPQMGGFGGYGGYGGMSGMGGGMYGSRFGGPFG